MLLIWNQIILVQNSKVFPDVIIKVKAVFYTHNGTHLPIEFGKLRQSKITLSPILNLYSAMFFASAK